VADRVESDSERITIVLADDHAMVRAGLRRVLDAERDLRVVGEAGDADDALRLARAHEPQIVVLDLHMPGRSTLDAIPAFLAGAPRSAVIVLTMESEPTVARLALSSGAHGYVLKEAAGAELVEAVRAVAAGRIYLAPSLGARMAMARPTSERDARSTLPAPRGSWSRWRARSMRRTGTGSFTVTSSRRTC
jgi:two-component system response regulator NreC